MLLSSLRKLLMSFSLSATPPTSLVTVDAVSVPVGSTNRSGAKAHARREVKRFGMGTLRSQKGSKAVDTPPQCPHVTRDFSWPEKVSTRMLSLRDCKGKGVGDEVQRTPPNAREGLRYKTCFFCFSGLW